MKENKPLNVKITNLVTCYTDSDRLDNDFVVEISKAGTSPIDMYDLEEAEQDALAASDYDGTDEVCKKLLERELLEQKGTDLYFTSLAKETVEQTFLTYSFGATCEDADGYDLSTDILYLLDYGIISFSVDEKMLPLVLSNIQDFNSLILKSGNKVNITFETERSLYGAEDYEDVLISTGDDIWMSAAEARKLF